MNSASTDDGSARISAAFARARMENRAALMPYMTLGFPDMETSVRVVEAIAGAGADLIELGVPFSDPLADGPTIQHSTQMALNQGATVAGCLRLVAQLRAQGVTQPFLLMGYVNPILAYGVERYTAAAAAAGADGLILPDLPPEEAEEIENACIRHGLALVYLIAPSSPPERVEMVAGRTSGFLYLVSLSGVTGARAALAPGLAEFTQRVKRAAHTPIAVGFGISTTDQARTVGRLVDGVIVGSALIQAVERSADPVQGAAAFVKDLRQALESPD